MPAERWVGCYRLAFSDWVAQRPGVDVPPGERSLHLERRLAYEAGDSTVTPDGKNALVGATGAGTGLDIMIVPLDGGGRRSVHLATRDNEQGAVISPDGAWAAYSSDESGRTEIYVQAFPVPGNKQGVSDGGGKQPVWSADGNVLYYLDRDNVLMAANVTRNGSGLAFSRRSLFRAPPLQAVSGQRKTFAALGDGTFVFNVLADSMTVHTMRIGLNWAAR